VKRLAETLVFALLAATAVQAQITTSRVNVLVTGRHCNELKDVYLVINGDALENRWVRLDSLGNCRWTADLGDGSISTSVAQFSLRADLARSDCQKAAADEQALSANLEFACCVEGPLRNVSVKTEPPLPITYVRDVRPFEGARIRGIRCLELAAFSEGRGSIGGVQLAGESVRLSFGPFDRKQAPFGLLLDDIVVNARPVVLTRDDVVYRLLVQRAKGKERSAPSLSSNAISLDIKKLDDLKLKRAEIEVSK
jgi:hypothetical protein